MIRAPMGNKVYWDSRILRFERTLREDKELLASQKQNPSYGPQFWLDHSMYCMRFILLRYSRGDDVTQLRQHFKGILDAWELSNQLAEEICAEHRSDKCRDWTFNLSNLNHYNWCFWLIGLALVLEIPEDQWQRLLVLVDSEGEDVLLDRLIASRQPERKIGTQLLHKKPYARLLKAIDAPKESQIMLLKEFVDHWYSELARKGKEELWWYVYGDPIKHPLEMGSYFGRWCIEAVAAVKAFNLDDSLCLGHEHYPGDLLRPNGPSTHTARSGQDKSWFSKIFKGRGMRAE